MSKPGILFNELIDQYKLEKHLSQRRVTDHYSAFDVDENVQVDVEILLPNLADNPSYANRFISKIQTVAQLNHPHIAQIFQVGYAPNQRPYFAREHAEGITLAERLQELKNQNHPVHSIYALKLVRQIADALALSERLDIFHYDLNPENITFQQDGNITLTDLGVPRVRKTDNDTFLGNVRFDTRYWSPEQTQDKPLDPRSHVYSMGVILFELLTGHIIQSGPSSNSKIPRLGNKSALEKLRSDLSQETVRLVQKALRSSPWGRFQNSGDFLSAIDEAIQAEEFMLHSGSKIKSQTSSPRRLLTFGVPLLLLLIATVVGLILVNDSGSNSVEDDEGVVAVAAPPTRTPIPPTNTAVSTPTDEPTAVIIQNPLQLLSPTANESVNTNNFVTFSWEWPEPLTDNQTFFVYGYANTRQFVLSDVTINTSGNTYEATVPVSLFEQGDGAYRWQVVLLSSITRNAIAESDVSQFSLTLEATTTPTPSNTPTTTPSPTVTSTPTPLPQVEVILSSVSLRTGPGTVYDIIRFLVAGDVVRVIGRNAEGTWLNVVTNDNEVGWISVTVVETVGDTDLTAVPIAATIPPRPTATRTPIPSPVPTDTPVPDNGGGGGGNPPPPPPPNPGPPTKTPPPP